MFIILWQLKIIIIAFMVNMGIFVVFLLILMIILLDVYICGAILVLRFLVSLLMHYYNIMCIIHS